MKRFKNVLVVALLLAAVIVIFQNTETVETRLLFVTIEMPRVLLLLVVLLVGVVLGYLGATRWSRREGEKKS